MYHGCGRNPPILPAYPSCGYFMLVTALSEAPASRGGEVVSGRHLRLSGAGSKPPAAPSLKTIFLFLLHRPSAVFASSAFSFFGICGGRARRAALEARRARAAATEAAVVGRLRAHAPRCAHPARARAMILASGARGWLLASSASAAAARGAWRRVTPRRAARRTRRVGLRRTAASAHAHAR